MHPDDDADRRAEESERRMYEQGLYCPKCGNKRLSVNGQWVCLVCEARKGYKCPSCGKDTGKIDRNVPPTDDGEYITYCQNSECLGEPWLVKKGGK